MAGDPTNFDEANALLAVVRDDDDGARRILDGMTLRELQRLKIDAMNLAHLAYDVRRNKEMEGAGDGE